MKIRTKMMAIALCATMGMLGSNLVQAHGDHEKTSHDKKDSEPIKVPDTVAGIWHEIQEHKEELQKTISEKKLAEVHELAFEIRDYAKAMPDKSKDLPTEKMTRLQSAIKQIEKIASDLDSTGDAGDQAGTESNFKKLEGALKLIEVQYPPQTLKASEEKSEHHH